MQRCVRAQIKGTVTGVGFRFSTVRQARQYSGLQGYVRNLDARTVECVMQGDPEDVNAMLQWLQHGPATAQVTNVTVEELPPSTDLGPFRVL